MIADIPFRRKYPKILYSDTAMKILTGQSDAYTCAPLYSANKSKRIRRILLLCLTSANLLPIDQLSKIDNGHF